MEITIQGRKSVHFVITKESETYSRNDRRYTFEKTYLGSKTEERWYFERDRATQFISYDMAEDHLLLLQGGMYQIEKVFGIGYKKK